MSGFLLSILLALSAQVAWPSAVNENPLQSHDTPLRAPALAGYCATPDDAELRERLTSFCAGYLRAVLENDPRLSDCFPLMGHVMDEIVARQRTAPQNDNNVLARDFVVVVALDLCRQGRA